MMKKLFVIVVFSDGSIQIFPFNQPFQKERFQAGAKFYRVSENFTISKMSYWIGNGYKSQFVDEF